MVLPLAGLRVNLWAFLYGLHPRYDRPDCLVPGHVGVPAGVGRSLPAQVLQPASDPGPERHTGGRASAPQRELPRAVARPLPASLTSAQKTRAGGEPPAAWGPGRDCGSLTRQAQSCCLWGK